MVYSRHDFLRIAAAGLPFVVGAPWLCSGAAHARMEMEGGYAQAQADKIHNRSTEAAIRQAGEKPEEVKARVDRRLRELRTDSLDRANA
jgi:hypothetical protein